MSSIDKQFSNFAEDLIMIYRIRFIDGKDSYIFDSEVFLSDEDRLDQMLRWHVNEAHVLPLVDAVVEEMVRLTCGPSVS